MAAHRGDDLVDFAGQVVEARAALIPRHGDAMAKDGGVVAKDKVFISNALRPWIEARRRFHLSHAHIQMARTLGMNPSKLGKLANHRQQPWKAPLPVFIEHLYLRRFGKLKPDDVRSIEELAAAQQAKKQVKRQARVARKAAAAAGMPAANPNASMHDDAE